MQKNLNIEKITFKVVQMKFLAMHITNQKLSFNILTVGNLPNIFITSVPLCYSVAMATYLFFHSGTVLHAATLKFSQFTVKLC